MRVDAQQKKAKARSLTLAGAERAAEDANRALDADRQGLLIADLEEEDCISSEGELLE